MLFVVDYSPTVVCFLGLKLNFFYFFQKGKLRHYLLGLWIRQRYVEFLSATYKKEEFKAYAADHEVTLMSAECVLAGLYSLKPKDQWLSGLSWDPVPVHTMPEDEDAIAMLSKCDKYDQLFDEAKKADEFVKINKENADMFKLLSEKTGWDIQDIEYVRALYQIIYLYNNYNHSYIPSWTSELDGAKFAELAGIAWARETYTPEMKRLRAGPFFNVLFQYFDQVIAGKNTFKFVTMSSMIQVLTAVLNTVDAFDNHPIEFGAAIVWELSNSEGKNLLNMYYREYDTQDLKPLKLKGCDDYACEYTTVKNLLKNYIVDKETWVKECTL